MCEALKRYYVFMDKLDNYDKILSKYCYDYGIDDDIMKQFIEEERNKAGSSLLANFEAYCGGTFPLKDSKEEKYTSISEILILCYEQPDRSWNQNMPSLLPNSK